MSKPPAVDSTLDASNVVKLEQFSTLDAPAKAVTGSIKRRKPDGQWEDCRALQGTEWMTRIPAGEVNQAVLLALWGSGTYKVIWHAAEGGIAGKTRDIALDDPAHPGKAADWRPPQEKASAHPPRPATRRALPDGLENVSAHQALAMHYAAEEAAEEKYNRRAAEQQREHERAMEREEARHMRHMQMERQGFEFLLQASRQAQAPVAPAPDPALRAVAGMLRKMNDRLEELETDGGGADDGDDDPLTRLVNKWGPAVESFVVPFVQRMQQQRAQQAPQQQPLPPANSDPTSS
jgi:hypothetical protein